MRCWSWMQLVCFSAFCSWWWKCTWVFGSIWRTWTTHSTYIPSPIPHLITLYACTPHAMLELDMQWFAPWSVLQLVVQVHMGVWKHVAHADDAFHFTCPHLPLTYSFCVVSACTPHALLLVFMSRIILTLCNNLTLTLCTHAHTYHPHPRSLTLPICFLSPQDGACPIEHAFTQEEGGAQSCRCKGQDDAGARQGHLRSGRTTSV